MTGDLSNKKYSQNTISDFSRNLDESSENKASVIVDQTEKNNITIDGCHTTHEIVKTGNKPEYIVGIGASAGGLEALQDLIETMPLQPGMVFVIIQHLSPDYCSVMDELLRRKTSIPVQMSEDRMVLEENTIYLLPPKKEMIVSNGELLLTERTNAEALNLPINTFFRSMAESYQERCVAIILSGTGADGSVGASIVHDNGGMVLVQKPDSALFDGMPNSAISTGKFDLILKPSEMPLVLVKYVAKTSSVVKQITTNSANFEKNHFAETALLLDSRYGLDLSHYKPSIITRRIERRLNMQGCTLQEYTNILLDNRNELDALYQDLLIGVTGFFRDASAFNSLRSEILRLLNKFSQEEELRLWVAACATGQEAYTLAILLNEILEKENFKIKFRIFATDIHQKFIDHAARGIYSLEDIEGINKQRRERYLTKNAEGFYQVDKKLRRNIIFAQHNLLDDPPFTKIHLLTCRNALIYFNQSAQQRVLSLFTFALKHDGTLFLGSSESLGRHEEDYRTVDTKNKIFQKKRESNYRLNINVNGNSKFKKIERIQNKTEDNNGSMAGLKRQKALDILLQRFVPPSVLIDDNANILHIFGQAGEFLSFDIGMASLNLRSFLGDSAKIVIMHMISQVKEERKPVKSLDVPGFVHHDTVDVEIYPLSNAPIDIDYMLVSLSVGNEESSLEISDSSSSIVTHDNYSLKRLKELEGELQHTRESLQTTVEELEISNEELQATNEELMATNEELQTTNEELQFVNEELLIVNTEFKTKEQAEAEADEKSIVETSGINILFLDMHLNIRKYSQSVTQLLDLSPADIGRPFATASGSVVQQLLAEVNQVLNEGGLIEKEFIKDKNEAYQLQIQRLEPTELDKAEPRGVILTFTNISKMYSAQARMAQSENRLQTLLDNLTDGYIEWVWEEDSVYIGHQTQNLLGYSSESNLDWRMLLGQRYEEFISLFDKHRISSQVFEQILPLETANGSYYWVLCKGHFEKQQQGNKELERFSGQLVDVNRFMQFEQELKSQMKELSCSNEILEEFAHIVSHDLKAPLRHANHSLGFLKEALDNKEESAVHEEMDDLRKHMDSLKHLIDDVIRFSRVSSEKKNETTVDLNDAMMAALELNSHTISEKNVDVQRDELPSVPGDRGMLIHVFQNLIGNACKYNNKKEKSIIITHEVNAGNCLIHIKDNGIGFDSKLASNVFKPFKRLVTKDQYEGSGIGLSICKILIEQHYGEIRCDSVREQGSVFTIQIPMNRITN